MYKVMIADDEPIVRKGLVQLIQWHELGCELVYTAKDGRELLDHLHLFNPDIIICDIKMPRADGIDVARYLWDTQAKSKLILLTAYADFSYAQSAVKYGVIDYVTKTGALEGIVDAIQKCKELIKRDNPDNKPANKEALRLNLLKSIIDSSLFIEQDMLALANEHDIQLQHYIALCIKLDSASHTGGKPLPAHSNMQSLLATALSEDKTFIIPLTKNSYCIIINESGSYSKLRIHSLCREIVKTVETFSNDIIYIGISEQTSSLLELHHAYQQAAAALSRRFHSEQAKIYEFNQEEFDHHTYFAQIDVLVDKISIEIQRGNTSAALDYAGQLLTIQKINRLSETDIKNTGIAIINKCKKIVAELEDQGALNIDKSYDITSSTFFRQYEAHLLQAIKYTSDYIQRTSKSRYNIINEAMHYIEGNYEKNITLNDIASSINVNSSYLSRLFKEKTGDTIINTVNHLKIEKAKTCLSHTNMKIYEVAESIGIDDTTYFSHFFKRYTNMSPSQYKEKYNKPI